MASTIIPTAPQIYNTNTVFEVDDDFDNFKEILKSQQPKQVPDAVFDEDPLALSVTSYLIWKNNPVRRWVPVNEVGRPTSEARALAHEIRKYYLHRSTMKILQGNQPTEFQQKMIGFLADTRPLKIDELGVLYRIPYFYQEDLALDLVFEGATDIADENGAPVSVPWNQYFTMHNPLTPIREILVSRHSGDYIQFWFKTTDDHRCVYDVKTDNKLLSVFKSLFRRDTLQVKSTATARQLRGSHIKTRYLKLNNLEIE